MFSYPVKFYNNNFKNSPVLSDGTGNLTALLDAVLVNGFNTVTLSSLTHSGYVATATFAGHGFLIDQIIEINGANETGYNGQWRVLSSNFQTNTFQFLLDSAVTTPTTGTGTITCKTPPLNFEIAFTGTNKRAYRSKSILSNRFYLKVDDDLDPVWNSTYMRYAKVGMFEQMTDIDSTIGNFAPSADGDPTRNWVGSGSGVTAIGGWYKWHYAGNTWVGGGATYEQNGAHTPYPRIWSIFGDDRGFYIFIEPHGSVGKWGACFTDFISNKIGDGYNTLFSARDWYYRANDALGTYNVTDINTEFGVAENSYGKLIMRNYTGVGRAVPWSMLPAISANVTMNQHLSGRNTGTSFPNPMDNSIIIAPIYIKEGSGVRGRLPGIMWIGNDINTSVTEYSKFSGFTEYPGRTFMTVQTSFSNRTLTTNDYTQRENLMIDITGPWY